MAGSVRPRLLAFFGLILSAGCGGNPSDSAGIPHGGMIDLGSLGGTRSQARGVSRSGNVVIGTSTEANGTFRAFRSVAGGPMTSLGVPGIDSLADAVSADERFVVGTLRNNSGRFRAFRWSESKGAEIIHEAPSLDTWAVDVSADGSVVIGISNDGTSRSFRWSKATGFHYWVPYRDGGSDYVSKTSEDGTISIGQCTFSNPLETKACVWRGTSRPVLIGDLGGRMSAATEMNSDGSVIVGWSQTSSGEYRAFRWTAASGVQSIGTLDNLPSQATCVSEDGNIIYGRLWKSDGSGLNRGFRWTASGGMTEFPSLGGNDVQPLATNRDGTVVVGIANDAMGRQRAFRYVAP